MSAAGWVMIISVFGMVYYTIVHGEKITNWYIPSTRIKYGAALTISAAGRGKYFDCSQLRTYATSVRFSGFEAVIPAFLRQEFIVVALSIISPHSMTRMACRVLPSKAGGRCKDGPAFHGAFMPC
jgi:hypothetical protein